jgi:hypothetical protein
MRDVQLLTKDRNCSAGGRQSRGPGAGHWDRSISHFLSAAAWFVTKKDGEKGVQGSPCRGLGCPQNLFSSLLPP